MPGIDPSVMVHRLNVSPSFPPIQQKKRMFALERDRAITKEIRKLQEVSFIREVYYPNRLANVVTVKKASGNWRMCVDFTDLNKACPKDSYPLPRVDVLVDSTARHQLLSFMDAFSGYNQIRMHETNQEKTSFVTSQGIFCYKVMPFGLKNAGATYQRLMNKMFAQQIGRNVQVYVDDMLVKSRREEDHLEDLRETFDTLRSYNIKFNPGKCAFGVTAGKFLGFMVSQRGIEANLDKIPAIMEMAPPRYVKEVQSLNGKIVTLNRFVSRATDKCLPFFRTLKKSFKWTVECQQAFEELKAYLSAPPLLSPSQPGEKLFSLPSCLPHRRQHSLDQGGRKSTEALILCQLCASRSRRKILAHGEICLCISYGNSLTQAVLPSPYANHPDRQAPTMSNEQP